MYLALSFSIAIHLLLYGGLYIQFDQEPDPKSQPVSIKFEKLKIVTGQNGKALTRKKSHSLKPKPFTSYSQLLNATTDFAIPKGGLQIASDVPIGDADGFRQDQGQIGQSLKLGYDIKLAIPAPLFIRILKGTEESEAVLQKCKNGNGWYIRKLRGENLLRTYLFEKLLKETMFVDNAQFLEKTPYKQLKISVRVVQQDFTTDKEYSIDAMGNHYRINYFMPASMPRDMMQGFNEYTSEINRKFPATIEGLKNTDMLDSLMGISRLWLDDDEDLPEYLQVTMNQQIRASINRTIKQLKRSVAYTHPQKAIEQSRCL